MSAQLTLDEIKRISLDILVDVHEFCSAHDIKYSLAYGTLIGAIRHKGFIPWDDDVDIVMPRQDFERFCKEYNSKYGYQVLSPHSPESLITFGRVYDTRLTICRTTAPWSTFETGVWIDVFPLDGVEDNYKAFHNRVKSLYFTAKCLAMKRTSLEGFWSTKTLKRKFSWIIKRMLTRWYSFDILKSRYMTEIQKYDFNSCNFFGQLGCYDNCTIKEHNPIKDFDYCVYVEFEGKKLLAMNGYDNILRRYYGNYMQFPPIEQQHPKITSFLQFYWK